MSIIFSFDSLHIWCEWLPLIEYHLLTQDGIMEEFQVFCDENYGGTFNGCPETLHLSLEQFIKTRVRTAIPNVILDHRTPLVHCFSYLRGNDERFFYRNAAGEEKNKYIRLPASIFSHYGSQFLNDLIQDPNYQVHGRPGRIG